MNKRAYSLGVRAETAAATRERIVEAAQALFVDPSADFTLDRIAAMAQVSVQTVLRAFGSKEGLIIAAIGTLRASQEALVVEAASSAREAVGRLFDDYEEIGDRVVRMLAQEHRIAGFAATAAHGRAMHRAWVEATFAEQLAKHPSRGRPRVVVALIAATDVYVWKLLRRDLGLDRKAAEAAVARLVRGALTTAKGD